MTENLPKSGSKMLYSSDWSLSNAPIFEVTILGHYGWRNVPALAFAVIEFEDGESQTTLLNQLRPLPEVQP